MIQVRHQFILSEFSLRRKSMLTTSLVICHVNNLESDIEWEEYAIIMILFESSFTDAKNEQEIANLNFLSAIISSMQNEIKPSVIPIFCDGVGLSNSTNQQGKALEQKFPYFTNLIGVDWRTKGYETETEEEFLQRILSFITLRYIENKSK